MQPSPHKAVSSGERYAVVIGINTYRDSTIPSLSFAANDAVAMRDFLVHPELGRFKKENVHLLLDHEATLGDIRSQFVYWLGACVQNQDEVWVYFSGRGTTDRTFSTATGQPFTNYLIAHDTLREDLPGSAISIKQLDEWLDLLGDPRVVLLFDCGFSAIDRGRALASSKAPALDDFAFMPALAQGKKRFIFAGTGPTEISVEDTEIELGLFSRVLLQHLRTAALAQGTSRMTWNDFYQTVAAEVAWQAEAHGAMQKPVKFGVLAAEPVLAYRYALAAPVIIPTPESKPAPEPWPAPEPAVISVPEIPVAADFAKKPTDLYQTSLHNATAEQEAEAFAPAEGVGPDVVTREHVEELLHQAKEAVRGGNLIRAQEALEKAIALDPNERRAATGLHKIEEAIRQADPTDLIKMALRYTDEKKYSEAMRYYAKVLELDPRSESARLGIESCRELLEKQTLSRNPNGRPGPPRPALEKPAHLHHTTYNETIWPYVGWVALLGCIWRLFSTPAEGDSTAWIFWKTVYSGLAGGVIGLMIGSAVYLVKQLIAHFEDRRLKSMADNSQVQ